MSSPIPPTPLQGHCSVIYDETLYVYSPGAFQALPLKKGAKWSKLQNGVSVNGAACVAQAGNVTSNSDGLWVVGGASTDTKSDYPGLQKYTFADKKWRTIVPAVKVTEHRQAHASVYLPASSKILVYGGSQDDPTIPSIETFIIDVEPPYGVQSATSNNTQVTWPQLVQWDDTSAITVGGMTATGVPNEDVFLFNQSTGSWKHIKPSLATEMKDSSVEQATLVQGSDGSKILQLYDLSVSPNVVTEIVLQDASGKPASKGQVPGQGKGKKRKRALTLKGWPRYKAKNAPRQKRSGFAIAQGSHGLVAISGGGSKSQPVELFDQETNSWVDNVHFFGVQPHHPQKPLGGSHGHGSPTPPHTAAPGPSTGQDDSHPQTSLILGATLGSILGFVALLIIFLLLLRWHRQKKRRDAQDAEERDEKDRLSFADRGDPFMKEIGASGYHPHEPMAAELITAAKVGHRRSETRGSENSTTFLVPKKDGAYRMNGAMEMGPMREKAGLTIPTIAERDSKANSLQIPGTQQKRTSGWSRYFSGADGLSVGARSSARNSERKSTPRGSTLAVPSARKSGLSASSTRSSRDSYSRYSQSVHDCSTHGPTQIPPLDMGQNFNDGRINRVVTGNNVIGPSEGDARISVERPRTVSSTFSTVPPSTISDTVFSHESPEETTNWTPVTRSENTRPGMRHTASSSIYAGSADGGDPVYQQGPRVSAPATATIRTVSGAVVVPGAVDGPIKEEDEPQFQKAQPSVATIITVPGPRKAEQAVLQDDMGWIDLNPNSGAHQ